jgi:hypothetical protein
MSHALEEVQVCERLELSPGQFAGDPARGGQLTPRHDSMSASELQGNPLAAAERQSSLYTFG